MGELVEPGQPFRLGGGAQESVREINMNAMSLGMEWRPV